VTQAALLVAALLTRAASRTQAAFTHVLGSATTITFGLVSTPPRRLGIVSIPPRRLNLDSIFDTEVRTRVRGLSADYA
jgi:hypothetical protein